MSAALRVGVWGLGPHAVNRILPALAATEGLLIHSVCSRNADVVQRTAVDHSCRAFTSSNAFLDDADLDVVYVSTPIALHFEQCRAALRAKTSKRSG